MLVKKVSDINLVFICFFLYCVFAYYLRGEIKIYIKQILYIDAYTDVT